MKKMLQADTAPNLVPERGMSYLPPDVLDGLFPPLYLQLQNVNQRRPSL